ncbi:MAG: MiaB/RimO family radical SAM methylthiotransferase [Anaerolineales bacterium]
MNIYLDMIGCRLNQSEIEIMARQFAAAGHTLVADPAEADLAVVNTCTVTGAAAADSRKTIRRIARSGVEKIITTGCWSSMYPGQALELPGVTQVVSNLEKGNLVSDLFSLDLEIFDKEPIERVPIPGSRLRTRAFIKVQDGCRHNCTFCVTTIARGESRSELADIVIRDIKAAHDGGVKEAVLTGVQLGSWGMDFESASSLTSLVEKILKETDIPRLRLSSIEPWDVNQDLIMLLQEDRIARHLHLPLQSGSASVMRRMARAITPTSYAKLIDQIRELIPGIAITTDIMSGFPGETDQEFQESLGFIQEMGFADGHVFTYSAREGTPAHDYPDQVHNALRKERSAQVREILAASAEVYRQKQIGTELIVLWEKVESLSENTWQASGLTDNYLRVDSEITENLWNRFSRIKIRGITPEGVKGDIS